MTKLLEYKTRRFVKQNRDDMDIETTHKLSRTALAYLLNLRHHGWTRDKPYNIGQQNIISVICFFPQERMFVIYEFLNKKNCLTRQNFSKKPNKKKTNFLRLLVIHFSIYMILLYAVVSRHAPVL